MTQTPKAVIRGHKIMLMGFPGAGKSHACALLAGCGKRVIYLLIEPTSLPVMQKVWIETYGKVPDNVHWHTFDYTGASLDELETLARAFATHDGDALVAWKSPYQKAHTELTRLQEVLKDFPDERTGTKLGRVDTWGLDTIFVVESLSAFCQVVWGQAYGGRIDIDAKEYGKAQGFLGVFFSSACWGWPCNMVLTAHIEERAKDKSAQQQKAKEIEWKWYPKLIGDKLRGSFTGYFDEVVLAKRLGGQFVWDTYSANADVKFRLLPSKPNLPPDFRPIFAKRAELSQASQTPAQSDPT